MVRKEFLEKCRLTARPHMLDQWIAKRIINPEKDASDNRIYTNEDYLKLKEKGLVR